VFLSLDKWRRKPICPLCSQNPHFSVDCRPVKKTGFRVLAFDQATITSGWSVYDSGHLIKYGKWQSEGNNHTERVSKTKQWVASMIENWHPDIVAFEDIQLQQLESGRNESVTTYKKLASLQGVLINYTYEKGIPFSVVPPGTWRNYNQIKGRSRSDQKKNAQIKVKTLFDINVTNDEADAILIGRYVDYVQSQSQMVEFI
jgi:Holliday junction resolvasome RuvABC endonuclease subunit